MDEFEVIGGRQLYQWDTDRSIEVRLCDGETVNEVHYAHAEDDIAPVVKVQDYDGRMFADIPNILLQRFGTLKVWAVVYTEDGRQTLRNAYLSVRARAKPDDYVYTETEIMDYRKVAEDLAELVQRVEEIEENGVQGGGAVASVNGKTGEVYLNAADVGALPTTGGNLTGNLTAPRLISTAADADGNIYEVQLYPTANGGLYMPLRHNGAVANAMSMSQSATTFGKPVAVSSGGHGGKNAAEGRKNLDLYSKEEVDAKIPKPYTLPTASADTLGGVKIGEGLQMDGDVLVVKPEGEWEQIENITVLEDGLTSITRSAFPDGTPYNLSAVKVMVRIFYPIPEQIGTSCIVKSGTKTLASMVQSAAKNTNTNTKQAHSLVFQAKPNAGIYEFVSATGNQGGNMEMSYPVNNMGQVEKTEQKITEITFEVWIGGSIPTGTTVGIWGVRADA